MKNNFLIYDGKLEQYLGVSDTVEIPEGVTTIATGAFEGCRGLRDIKIPNGVIKIEQFAFANCTIRNLLIPQSTTDIELNAFINCGCLEHIAVDKGNVRYDSRNGCNAIVETTTNMLLKGCQNTLIPKDVNEIDAMAFDGCKGLTQIIIPPNVTQIYEFAFGSCKDLKEGIISEGVQSIYCCAFIGCNNLEKLVLPSSVTFIGVDAFGACDNLTIHCPAGSYAEQYAKEQGLRYEIVCTTNQQENEQM